MASRSGSMRTDANDECCLGSSGRNFGNSASSNRVVVRRGSARMPSRPSAPTARPSEPSPKARVTGSLEPASSERAVSASVLAGMSSSALPSGI